MPRHLGERAVRFLCRWHSSWSGVPSQRPIGLAIALVIVGGSLLETGAIAFTPIESDDSPAPIAAVTGSGDAFVAMSAPDPGARLTPQGAEVPAPGSTPVMAAIAPTRSLALTGTLDAWATLGTLRSDHGADALIASAPTTSGHPPVPAATVPPVPVATTQAAEQAPAARKHARQKPRWWRKAGPWRNSPRVTWYGPGFYGNRTACGQRYTRYVAGVAHRTLPCGTMVQFRWHGRTAVAPVIDRGPYGGRDLVFDWSAWLACKTFRPKGQRNGCFTRADVRYRVVGKVDLDRWFKRRKP